MNGNEDRIKGAIYGLLIGDALGVPYEFKPAEEIPPYSEIQYTPPIGYKRSHANVLPGTWSDDGAQALCLLDSLLERNSLNLIDFSQRLQNWYFNGYLAVDRNVFDIGIQTREAIIKLSKNFFPGESGSRGEHANGNGSLMRTLPLALWHSGTDSELVEEAHDQSLVTHAHPRSQACCALYCLWARRILENHPTPWEAAAESLQALYKDRPDISVELEDKIRPDASPSGEGSGYVVDSLHSARFACEELTFEQTIRRAIQFGNDTDTTACIAGGIAGLKFGYSQIPKHLIEGLRGKQLLAPLLQKLLARVNEVS